MPKKDILKYKSNVSSSHGIFTKIDHILGHKRQLKFKRREIIKCFEHSKPVS